MKIIYLITCTIISYTLTYAQDKDLTVRQVAEQLQKRYDMIDDAIIQFEQQVKYGFSNLEQNFNGTLMIRKPSQYRIESEHQKIVTDGVTVWAYSSVNNQVIIDKYKENSNSLSPEQFMINLPANYFATILGTEKTTTGRIVLLKLVPKDDRSFIKSVKLTIEERSWLVRKIEITDINETVTTYIVKDVKLNTNIKERTFVFEIPKGAEVVDLR